MTRRNATFDYARLVAACGIVLFHTGAPSAWIGYAALPFFTMLLIILALQTAGSQPFHRFTTGRAKRLLGPWLIWSVIYGFLKLVDVAVSGHPLSAEFAPWMLLTGPAIHLWFLPFAFVACLAAYPVARLPSDGGWLRWFSFAAIAALTLIAQYYAQDMTLPVPVRQWAFALPSAIFGLAFGLAGDDRTDLIITASLAVGISLISWMMGWNSGLAQFAIASGAVTVCFVLHLADSPLARFASALSLNIYLAHPLVASILERSGIVASATTIFALVTIVVTLVLAIVIHVGGKRSVGSPRPAA